MRIHISLDEDLVARLDARVGRRQRSRYLAAVLRRALDDADRWEQIEAAVGSVSQVSLEWDLDPAAWVHNERHRDSTRVG